MWVVCIQPSENAKLFQNWSKKKNTRDRKKESESAGGKWWRLKKSKETRDTRGSAYTLNYVYCSSKIFYSMKLQCPSAIVECRCNLYRWLHTYSTNAEARILALIRSFVSHNFSLVFVSVFITSIYIYKCGHFRAMTAAVQRHCKLCTIEH